MRDPSFTIFQNTQIEVGKCERDCRTKSEHHHYFWPENKQGDGQTHTQTHAQTIEHSILIGCKMHLTHKIPSVKLFAYSLRVKSEAVVLLTTICLSSDGLLILNPNYFPPILFNCQIHG